MYNGAYYNGINPYIYRPIMNGGLGLGTRGLGTGLSKLGTMKGFFNKMNWSGILSGAGRTLNVINQAIPIVRQVKPIINNAKTVFKVMGAINADDNTTKETVATNTPANTQNYTKTKETINNSTLTNNPTFFL